MKKYTDIKSARRCQRQLTEYFNWYKTRQEELRQYIQDKNIQKDAPLDIRLQIFAYRKTINHIQEELKQLNKNIRQLDRESAEKVVRQKEIYDLLIKLKNLSEAFNQMVGSLYSGICAGEINELLDTLNEKYGVKVSYYQMIPGRVQFNNLDSLIEEYQL